MIRNERENDAAAMSTVRSNGTLPKTSLKKKGLQNTDITVQEEVLTL